MDKLAGLQLTQQLIGVTSHVTGIDFISHDLSLGIYDKGSPLCYAIRLDIYLKIPGKNMCGVCQHRVADLFNPVRSIMPCFMNIMGVTGYGIHLATSRLEIRILIC